MDIEAMLRATAQDCENYLNDPTRLDEFTRRVLAELGLDDVGRPAGSKETEAGFEPA